MKSLFCIATGLLGLWAALGAGAEAPHHAPHARHAPHAKGPIRPGPWLTERVQLRSGRQLRGLIESEDDSWVYLTEIHQRPGHRLHLVIRPIARSSVAAVNRLEPPEQARLRERIDRWVNRARIESGRMDAVRLSQVDRHGIRFQHYRGRWFDLDSSTNEQTTRRIIVRIEQMFTAYRQVLPPRAQPRCRLRLVVLGSPEQYRAYLRRYGVSVSNPAVFVQKGNLVVAGSELARYLAELAEVEAQHDRVRDELRQLEAGLREKLRELSKKLQAQGMSRNRITRFLIQERRNAEAEIKGKQSLVKRYDRENAEKFDEVTRRMFARLYHEAFHAYLENYVYPHGQHDVPPWLDEGLAMVFENGILESDTLRIDAPHAAALQRLKDEIRAGRAMPLDELLAAGPEKFLVADGTSPAAADRYYGYAWGLVYYLTFEKGVLGTPALDAYVSAGAKATPPAARLEKLTGMPPRKLEAQWHDYVLSLQ